MGGEREIFQDMGVEMYLGCCMGNRKLCGCSAQRRMEEAGSERQRELYISMAEREFRILLKFKEAGLLEIFINGRDMEGEMEI